MDGDFQLKITATNIGPNGGAIVTPLWISSHNGSFDSFNIGEQASTGIEFLAEEGITGLEGTVPGFAEQLAMFGAIDPAVAPDPDETIAGLFEDSDAATDGGSQGLLVASIAGLLPGQSSSSFLELGDNPSTQNRYFDFAAMFFPSNDGFIGSPDPIELFDEYGNFIGADFIVTGDQVWDAGTEVNDEDFNNVPFLLTSVGNGVVENGTIQAHPGLLPAGEGGVLDAEVLPPPFRFQNSDFQTTNSQILRIKVEKVPVVDAFEFRTIDGSDNNGDQGAANTQLIRLFDNAFEDGIGTPRGGNFSTVLNGELVETSTLPNPRTISNIVADEVAPVTNFLNASDWLWQWGQFIDHDLDLAEANAANPAGPGDVQLIPVPGDDPIGDFLPFTRIPAADGTGTSTDNPREVNNQITSFIDASNVYGSDEERAEFLRDASAGPGLLKTSLSNDGSEVLLPLNDGTQENATGGVLDELGFVAGDIRSNEQVGLTAVHTLFVREHNRLAVELYERIDAGEPDLTAQFETFRVNHPLLSDEEAIDDFIYESARKVVGAQVQAITYNEFLPLLIGEGTVSAYEGFDADVNPQVSSEFANAAYRLGHTLLNNQLRRVDGYGVSEQTLEASFFTPEDVQENGVDNLLTGLIFQGAQAVDNQIVDGVRNFLFPAGTGGLDLAATNIARGREVGLPSYTEVYNQLFGEETGRISSFSDLGSGGLGLFSDAVVSLFEAAYETVDQIDLWLGGISERPDDHGGLLGPTLSFFIADQFTRARDGDEFFYLREGELEDLQLLDPNITETTLADIIRNNTEETYLVHDNVFEVPFENSIFGDGTANVLTGSNLDDLIDGREGDDRIRGRQGDDIAFGGGGDDTVFGNEGDDQVFGGYGDDELRGNAGKDTVVGGTGNDILLGGADDDVIDGQAGNDVAIGGGGRDTFVFGADILNDGYSDTDTIDRFQAQDILDLEGYLGAGGSIAVTRITNRFLQIDLNGEDQINIFGSNAALNAAELQLAEL